MQCVHQYSNHGTPPNGQVDILRAPSHNLPPFPVFPTYNPYAQHEICLSADRKCGLCSLAVEMDNNCEK